MRQNWHWGVTRTLVMVGVVLCVSSGLPATTIIFEFHLDRILILADSRSEDRKLNANETFGDKYCKLYVLGGKYLFAATGNTEYTRNEATDPVHEWSGATEALAAYATLGDNGNLREIAQNWGGHVSEDFAEFYRYNPARVRQISFQGHLLYGIFAGPDKTGLLKVYGVDVLIDDSLSSLVPIGYRLGEYEARDEPYSTHAITQELLDGTSDRAKEVAKLWDEQSRKIRKRDRHLRQLEFMVVQTGNFDPSVHEPVNAAQVTATGVAWLQKKTCC